MVGSASSSSAPAGSSGAPRASGERCGAVILAAGGGSRFVGATHKLLAPVDGKPVVRHVLEAVAASGLTPIIVVTGAAPLSEALAEPLVGNPTVVVIHNPRWRSGMASSLQCAIAAATEYGLAAVVVGLGDQPGVPANAWLRVAATNAPIAIATYSGVRRNPVRIHAELWSQLPHDGDEGARTLIRVRPELVTEVACEGNADDIDTADDVVRWQTRLAKRGNV
jgi:molybdenum cofactor cytidylyltransferase